MCCVALCCGRRWWRWRGGGGVSTLSCCLIVSCCRFPSVGRGDTAWRGRWRWRCCGGVVAFRIALPIYLPPCCFKSILNYIQCSDPILPSRILAYTNYRIPRWIPFFLPFPVSFIPLLNDTNASFFTRWYSPPFPNRRSSIPLAPGFPNSAFVTETLTTAGLVPGRVIESVYFSSSFHMSLLCFFGYTLYV